MIKTTIGSLSSPGLQMTLQKLNGMQVSTKTAYRFKKLNDAIQSMMTKVRDMYTKEMVDVYAEKNEKGNIIPDEVPWGFKLASGVVQETFDSANDEFHKREITIDREPLTVQDLNEVKISAAEISALGAFFSEPEEIQADNVAQIRR